MAARLGDAFEGKQKYSDWQFVFTPAAAPAATPKPAAAKPAAAKP
ncbi:MAG TPA: hypothetical protein VFC18_01605 [Burkholderiales bacterium]|nr:hypothetical protein [Burkholderiales bacterium]